ncbi:MAG: SRPBCC domain-containing protein [Leptospirales bacterium]
MGENTENTIEAIVDKTIPIAIEKVYDAWLNPESLKSWFGPPGHVVTNAELDIRIGGFYTIAMRSPENQTYTLTGKFIEIIPIKKLVYTWRWDQSELGDYDTEVSVDFISISNSTRIVIHHQKFRTAEHCEGHKVGWEGSIERLKFL